MASVGQHNVFQDGQRAWENITMVKNTCSQKVHVMGKDVLTFGKNGRWLPHASETVYFWL